MNPARHPLFGTVLAAAALAAAGLVRGADPEPPPVKMAPFVVSAAMTDIPVHIFYHSNFVGNYVQKMTVGKLKPKSAAAHAGLVAGMEIVAIEGTLVPGLTEQELKNLLSQEVGEGITLSVRQNPNDDTHPVFVPLPGPRHG